MRKDKNRHVKCVYWHRFASRTLHMPLFEKLFATVWSWQSEHAATRGEIKKKTEPNIEITTHKAIVVERNPFNKMLKMGGRLERYSISMGSPGQMAMDDA